MTKSSHYRENLTPDYVTARLLLKNEQPLPVDLAARLVAQGHDLSKFKDK